MPELYRKRLIPSECIHLKNDTIVSISDGHIITRWKTLHPKEEFSYGISYYVVKHGWKISKFYKENGTLAYIYCDIIDTSYDKNTDTYIFTDLLADVIIENDGFVRVVDLDELAEECQKILNTEYSDKLDELYRLGGTSGGTRPKIMTTINGEEWIIKFPAHVDGKDTGKMEYDYSCCARQCGIVMSETRLFPSDKCKGYFGTKRFDRRPDGKRLHMLTAAALLELDFEQPSLDYHQLMKLTKILTNGKAEDIENMFRRMCFNVFAHNRDDHSKNFTYIYREEEEQWRLGPAYDLTYSNTYYGEHTTSVDGNGRNPGEKELLAVGLAAGMKKTRCMELIKQIRTCVQDMLGHYL